MTLGVFLPAFGFPLIFPRQLEALITIPLLRNFLGGVTAGVVGLISITAVKLAFVATSKGGAAVIFAVALAVLSGWNSKLAVPAIIVAAGWFTF